jgi:hypothetical protein
MSKYRTLQYNVPKLNIKEGAREVIIKVVSSMCDNIAFFHFKKDTEGDFRLSNYNSHNIGMSYSNYQVPVTKEDLEWEADDGNWDSIVKLINSGVQSVESAKSR